MARNTRKGVPDPKDGRAPGYADNKEITTDAESEAGQKPKTELVTYNKNGKIVRPGRHGRETHISKR